MPVETDYLVVGAGPRGLTFTAALVTGADDVDVTVASLETPAAQD